MGRHRVRWNKSAFYELRTEEPGVVADLEARGERIRLAAVDISPESGAGYEVEGHKGAKRPQGRYRVTVSTSNPRGMASNAKHNTLIRALKAGE